MRRIKKLVLTGEETGWQNTYNPSLFGLKVSEKCMLHASGISSHYVFNPIQSGISAGLSDGEFAVQILNDGVNIYVKDTDYTTVDGWKAFLAAQYANGTPITVWYVLATPETAIVNEPLAKIGDYADELHSTDAGITIPTVRCSNTLTVDTTLQPSIVSITGHIKPL